MITDLTVSTEQFEVHNKNTHILDDDNAGSISGPETHNTVTGSQVAAQDTAWVDTFNNLAQTPGVQVGREDRRKYKKASIFAPPNPPNNNVHFSES